MAHHDRYGLALSTTSEVAAVAFRGGVDLMLSAWPDAALLFDEAIAADPEFALARAARARVALVHADIDAAKAHIAAASACVTRNGTERERSHVAVLALGVAGRPVEALAGALAHLETWPRDAIIMGLPLGAFGLYAFSGRADHNQARVTLCERHQRHYGTDWWFQTYYGWALTENGDRVAGRAATESGFIQRRQNANAAHAMSHALFECGAIDEASAMIADWLPCYDRRGLLYGHIHWHEALLALDNGDAARALAIFQDPLHPDITTAAPLNAMTDAASLLWRLKIYGHDVPETAWAATAAYGSRLFAGAGITFADAHMALIAAAVGDRAGLSGRVEAIEQKLRDGRHPAGPVVAALCRAVAAFADDDFAGCVRLLEPMGADVVRIGGSHAQRELVEDTLLVAMMRAGDVVKARALLDARLHRRPSPRDARWRAALPTATA